MNFTWKRKETKAQKESYREGTVVITEIHVDPAANKGFAKEESLSLLAVFHILCFGTAQINNINNIHTNINKTGTSLAI